MELYTTNDTEAIIDSFDKIVDETLTIKHETLEPTIEDYCKGIKVIKEFIKKKKRIVYGGNAFNDLIMQKNKDDAIYAKYSRGDYEFYTPEPLQDLVDLCNELHDRGFPFVQGTQAQHDSTYKIYVNFENLCDFTYIPKNVFLNMPVITINGIMYSDPSWLMVDVLRQHNDPIMSYERLRDKTFNRALKLFKNYPFDLDKKTKIENQSSNNDIKLSLFNAIKEMNTLIFTGSIAITYYQTLQRQMDFSKMEVLSTKFRQDCRSIHAMLRSILDDKFDNLEIVAYRPFFQFWDERVEFKLADDILLTVYGYNEICIPYNNLYIHDTTIEQIQTGGLYKEKKSEVAPIIIKLATFMVMFNHLLIHRQNEFIFRTKKYKMYEHIMYNLLKKRKEYLENESATVMDNTPYREFIVRCAGTPEDTRRNYLLRLMGRKKSKKAGTFRYSPETQKESFIMPEYTFSNMSGNPSDSLKERIFRLNDGH